MRQLDFAPNLTVHTHASGEGGIFANVYLIETSGGVVAVDATLSETESRALRHEPAAGRAEAQTVGSDFRHGVGTAMEYPNNRNRPRGVLSSQSVPNRSSPAGCRSTCRMLGSRS
jgi:hypothetical protein